MAHHQRAPQDNQPAKEEESHKDPTSRRVLDVPHNPRHRPPLPIEQAQAQAREENKRAPLNYCRNGPRPRSLEPWAGHHTVLHREEAQQKSIDHQGREVEVSLPRINGFRNQIVPDKSHRIEKRDQEEEISEDSVEKRSNLCHGRPPETSDLRGPRGWR